MKSRLLMLAAIVSGLSTLLLVAVMVSLVRPQVVDQLERDVRETLVRIAAFVQNGPEVDAVARILDTVDTSPDHRIGVISSGDLRPIGSDAQRMQGYVNALAHTTQVRPKDNVAYLPLRFSDDPDGSRIASEVVSDGTRYWIVDGRIPAAVIAQHKRDLWFRVAALAALSMIVALLGAAVVARWMTRPVQQAIAAAEAMGNGDLRAPTPRSGPREVIALGAALTRLAGRIERLLAGERDRAATLSHRLRTPLTVLRLEIERTSTTGSVNDRAHRALINLEEGLDDLIREFYTTRDEGISEACDAAAVLDHHLAAWAPLAASQQRQTTHTGGNEALPVAISAASLGTALDTLISNVYRHTHPPAGYHTSITATSFDCEIRLRNTKSPRDLPPLSGSTGRGLPIVQELIEKRGGELHLNVTEQQFEVTIRLPLVNGVDHPGLSDRRAVTAEITGTGVSRPGTGIAEPRAR